MAADGSICVVGSLHYDVMVRAARQPAVGETLVGEAWWWKPGGKGGNQAMAAARHGATVAMIGRLGADGFGEKLRERLTAAGVDSGAVGTIDDGSGMSVAIEQADGDYAAVVVSGANRSLDAAAVADEAAIIGAARVLLLQNEVADETNAAAAQLARANGALVVLNAAPARPMGMMAGLADILVVNAVEAAGLGSEPVTGLASAHEAAQALGSLAPAVIVTAGADGVAVAAEGLSMTVAAHAVDGGAAHGAGDAFSGSLGARLALGERLDAAVRYANAAAALHVGGSGGGEDGPDAVTALLAS